MIQLDIDPEVVKRIFEAARARGLEPGLNPRIPRSARSAP